jgi:hypothetical protein
MNKNFDEVVINLFKPETNNVLGETEKMEIADYTDCVDRVTPLEVFGRAGAWSFEERPPLNPFTVVFAIRRNANQVARVIINTQTGEVSLSENSNREALKWCKFRVRITRINHNRRPRK